MPWPGSQAPPIILMGKRGKRVNIALYKMDDEKWRKKICGAAYFTDRNPASGAPVDILAHTHARARVHHCIINLHVAIYNIQVISPIISLQNSVFCLYTLLYIPEIDELVLQILLHSLNMVWWRNGRAASNIKCMEKNSNGRWWPWGVCVWRLPPRVESVSIHTLVYM